MWKLTVTFLCTQAIDADRYAPGTGPSDDSFNNLLRLLVRGATSLQSLPASYYIDPSDLPNYENWELRDRGGFGDVFHSRWRDQGVALKVIRFYRRDTESQSLIFAPILREIILWHNLKHPNVHPLLGVRCHMSYAQLVLLSKWERHGSLKRAIRDFDIHRLHQLRPNWVGTSFG